MWSAHLRACALIRSEYNTFQFNLTKYDWQSSAIFIWLYFYLCVYRTTKETFLFSLFTLSKKKNKNKHSKTVPSLQGRPRKKSYQGIHQLGPEHYTVEIDVLMRFYTNFYYLLVYFSVVWLLLFRDKVNTILQILLVFLFNWHQLRKKYTTENSDRLWWH